MEHKPAITAISNEATQEAALEELLQSVQDKVNRLLDKLNNLAVSLPIEV